MVALFRQWYNRYFSDPEAVFLFLFLVTIGVVILFFGEILTPILASVVIAYVLDSMVNFLRRWGVPRPIGISFAFLLFIGVIVALSVWIGPLLVKQLTGLFGELPAMIANVQHSLHLLPENYPQIISESQINEIMVIARSEISQLGQYVVSFSLSSIMSLMTFVVYMLIVPLIVFFFLKDQDDILRWCSKFLPERRKLLDRVWKQVDQQFGNYITGKLVELVIVVIMTYIPFAWFGLEYAFLLSVLAGLSIFIPYIGGIVVTIPIVAVAFFQWGWTPDFFWLISAYALTQIIDGNVIVPLLFSEAIDMHPVVIILAILVFGGLWGIWGMFFAIPLAILLKALIETWPRSTVKSRK